MAAWSEPADAVRAKSLAQVPQRVGPDLAVIVRLADHEPEDRQAEEVAVGLVVDLPDAARRRGVLGEHGIVVDAVREEVAAALSNRIGLDAGEVQGSTGC
jgi:hypothetical protein